MKIGYSIDDKNRLIIKRGKKILTASGNFSVDNKNRLSFLVSEPLKWRRINKLPPRIEFEGTWRIDQDHNLEFLISSDNDNQDKRLLLKGEIICPQPCAFVFEIKTANKDGLDQFYTVKLSGFWQADDHNRLSFNVKKQDYPDQLTLQGAWSVDKNQQIVYSYIRTELKKKTKTKQSVVFNGFWQITTTHRLAYVLSAENNSLFDFRVQLQTPSLYPDSDSIKYKLGIGLEEDLNFCERAIALFGSWNFNRKVGIAFEMDYGPKSRHVIVFSAEAHFGTKDTLNFILTNRQLEPLGFSLVLTHKFLKKCDAELFLKIKKTLEDSRIETGVRIPF